jgi:hypothetical protein
MICTETDFQEFVEFSHHKYRDLASREPSLSWANEIKRLAQATGEVLMTASTLLQETELFADLKLTHGRILKLMAQHTNLIDGENSVGNRFHEW